MIFSQRLLASAPAGLLQLALGRLVGVGIGPHRDRLWLVALVAELLAQLFDRCLAAGPEVTFAVVNGISNNRVLRMDLEETKQLLGYAPQDDAEVFAAELEGKAAPGGEIAALFHGGSVCALGFTADPNRVE